MGHATSAMPIAGDHREKAMDLVRRSMCRFEAAGMKTKGELLEVSNKPLCELWGGMGAIVELKLTLSSAEKRNLIAKVIDLPAHPKKHIRAPQEDVIRSRGALL